MRLTGLFTEMPFTAIATAKAPANTAMAIFATWIRNRCFVTMSPDPNADVTAPDL